MLVWDLGVVLVSLDLAVVLVWDLAVVLVWDLAVVLVWDLAVVLVWDLAVVLVWDLAVVLVLDDGVVLVWDDCLLLEDCWLSVLVGLLPLLWLMGLGEVRFNDCLCVLFLALSVFACKAFHLCNYFFCLLVCIKVDA